MADQPSAGGSLLPSEGGLLLLSAEARARYPWRYHWDEETVALTSATIRAYVHGRNIRLANFRDAWEA